MKTLKKILKYSIIILVLILVFRGWIYRNTFHYTIIKERNPIELTDKTLKTEIDKEITGENLTLSQTIKIARKTTNKNLFFSGEKISFNPNISIKTGKANCIGYSAMFSSVFNYIVKKQNNNTKYRVKHLGVKVVDAGIRDIILPGDIKEIMNQVLVAQKKAQANTISRREETAATRSLLNTAKLMDYNPMLYQLKEMEYVEKIAEKIGEITVSGNGGMVKQLKDIFSVKA